jgi:hypothetical protein
VKKPEGKRLPERRRLSWIYDLQINVQNIVCGVARFYAAQDRVMWRALVDVILHISVS